MEELIQQIQTEFANGAPEFRIRSDLFSLAFGTAPDNGVHTIANLIALSNGWEASVESDCIKFMPGSEFEFPLPDPPSIYP